MARLSSKHSRKSGVPRGPFASQCDRCFLDVSPSTHVDALMPNLLHIPGIVPVSYALYALPYICLIKNPA